MSNSKFEEICSIAALNVASFRSNLVATDLLEVVETLPDDLSSLMKANKRRNSENLHFQDITVRFLEQVNAKLKVFPGGEQKSTIKSHIQAFCYHTIKQLIQEYPELATIEEEIEKGLDKYQQKAETDADDLRLHTRLFRKEKKRTSPLRNKQKQNSCYGFVQHLGKTFEDFNASFVKEYGIAKSVADLRNLFPTKRKVIQSIAVPNRKLPIFICLMHKLWKKGLIHPHEGGFWETLAGCLVDKSNQLTAEHLRKTHSRIKAKPGEKHARLASEVDALMKIAQKS